MTEMDEKAEDAGESQEMEEESQDEETTEADEGEASASAEEPGESAEDEPKPKEKKPRKVVRRRKTKKERENPLTTAVRLAVESGKVEFGSKTALSASLGGKAKLFVIAGNAPGEVREKIAGYAKASNTPVLEFEGSSMELGSVCGRPFPISVLSVYAEGSSNIMELAKKK